MGIASAFGKVLSFGMYGEPSEDQYVVIAAAWLIIILVFIFQLGWGQSIINKLSSKDGYTSYTEGAFASQMQPRGVGINGFQPNASNVSTSELNKVAAGITNTHA